MQKNLIDKRLLTLYDNKIKYAGSILNSNTTYKEGEILFFEGCILKVTKSGTTDTTVASVRKFLSTASSGDTTASGTAELQLIKITYDILINDWKKNTKYIVNNVVIYKNKLYRCIKEHTSTTDIYTDIANWEYISPFHDWETNTKYIVNDFAIYEDRIYRCTTAHASGSAFDSTKWSEISKLEHIIVPWAAKTDYKVGDLVHYENVIYKANKAHTSTTFSADASSWDNMYSNIREYVDNTFYKTGSYVLYDNNIYVASKDTTENIGKNVVKEVNNIEFNDSSNKYIKANSDGSVTEPNEDYINTVIDLGSMLNITQVVLSDYGTGYCGTGQTDLEISTDGTTYVKADSVSNSGYWNSIDPMIFNIYKKARYIKIVFVSVFKSSGNDFSYALCQVYSTSKDWKKITNTQKPTINSWSSNTEYEKNEIILYNNKIYKCNKSHTSTTNFDSDKLIYWNSLNDNPIINDWASGGQYEAGSVVIVTNTSGISKWKENTPYKVGDSVVYNGYVYVCSTANSDTTFTEGNWSLKEPVYNRIYRCITSNKDTTFDTSKWQLINGDAEAMPQEVEDLLL